MERTIMHHEVPGIVVTDAPEDADRQAILNGLSAYNENQVGSSGIRPLAILLKDPDTGETVGGLWGRTSYDWLYVELLFVPGRFRGQNLGSQLLNQAEQVGLQRGCVGVWLNTFAFQARGFYEKQGYEVFGVLDEYPRGGERYFLRKSLVEAS